MKNPLPEEDVEEDVMVAQRQEVTRELLRAPQEMRSKKLMEERATVHKRRP